MISNTILIWTAAALGQWTPVDRGGGGLSVSSQSSDTPDGQEWGYR